MARAYRHRDLLTGWSQVVDKVGNFEDTLRLNLLEPEEEYYIQLNFNGANVVSSETGKVLSTFVATKEWRM